MTAVRHAGITELYFAVCTDHGWRVDGDQAFVTHAAEVHDSEWHCHSATCQDSLSNEDLDRDDGLCTSCYLAGLEDDEANRKGDLEREKAVFG